MTITAEQKLASVSRELKMRRRVYPKWVEGGRMTKEQSEREIAIFEAIELDYQAKAAGERLL